MKQKLFARSLHRGRKIATLDVPDSAQRVVVSLRRHVTASPTAWRGRDQKITWRVQQFLDASVLEGLRQMFQALDLAEIAAGRPPAMPQVRERQMADLTARLGTWLELGSDETVGGVWVHEVTKEELTESYNDHGLLSGENRKLRVVLEVHKGAIDTEATIVWL